METLDTGLINLVFDTERRQLEDIIISHFGSEWGILRFDIQDTNLVAVTEVNDSGEATKTRLVAQTTEDGNYIVDPGLNFALRFAEQETTKQIKEFDDSVNAAIKSTIQRLFDLTKIVKGEAIWSESVTAPTIEETTELISELAPEVIEIALDPRTNLRHIEQISMLANTGALKAVVTAPRAGVAFRHVGSTLSILAVDGYRILYRNFQTIEGFKSTGPRRDAAWTDRTSYHAMGLGEFVRKYLTFPRPSTSVHASRINYIPDPDTQSLINRWQDEGMPMGKNVLPHVDVQYGPSSGYDPFGF